MGKTEIKKADYSVTRFTIDVGCSLKDFRERYEAIVPPAPIDRITELVRRKASWEEMLDLINKTAPWGFLIYHVTDPDAVMRLAGHDSTCISYLMGNHTIAERMYRHEPSVLLYAPLHTAIWTYHADEPAKFSFDKPSDQFGSFGNPDITTVGIELNKKMAILLEKLGIEIPDSL